MEKANRAVVRILIVFLSSVENYDMIASVRPHWSLCWAETVWSRAQVARRLSGAFREIRVRDGGGLVEGC